jgi:BirA family biotin operon repressor/biotin-[acetyl-CoA-carboxylase] ligase
MESFPLLAIEELRGTLQTALIGKTLIYSPTLDSTNTLAMNLIRPPHGGQPAAEGTVVLTDHQPGGRGRQGRHWKSLPGQQILLSIIVYPPFPITYLVMCTALAVREAIAQTTTLTPAIKWPNDVLLAGKKVCGILIETTSSPEGRWCAVVGIGVNVFGSFKEDHELAERATSIAEQGISAIRREALIAALLQRFEEHYLQLQYQGTEGARQVWEDWRKHLATLGHRVRVQQGEHFIEGEARDVGADGALLVRQSDGTTAQIHWGDVHLLS